MSILVQSLSLFFLTVLKLWILTNNLNALSSSANFGYPMFGISYRKAVCLHSLEMSALLLHVLYSRKSLAQSDPEVSWSRHSENTCVKTSQLLSKIIQKYNQKKQTNPKNKECSEHEWTFLLNLDIKVVNNACLYCSHPVLKHTNLRNISTMFSMQAEKP